MNVNGERPDVFHLSRTNISNNVGRCDVDEDKHGGCLIFVNEKTSSTYYKYNLLLILSNQFNFVETSTNYIFKVFKQIKSILLKRTWFFRRSFRT